MSARGILLIAALSCSVAGCGTYVPALEEYGGEPESQALFQDIATNVMCEMRDTVAAIYRGPQHTFLDTWGVQSTLTFSLDEKSAANPTANILPPSPASAVFNLGIGGTLSAGALRTSKVSAFYTIKELRDLGRCGDGVRVSGPMLLQNDLKLKEWLFSVMSTSATRIISFSRNKKDGPFKGDVISHSVKFEVLTSGGITPGWRLVRANVNQSGTFLSASRTRTHNLSMTFGPTDFVAVPVQLPGQGFRIVRSTTLGPSQAAANAHLATEIGNAVANSLRGIQQQ